MSVSQILRTVEQLDAAPDWSVIIGTDYDEETQMGYHVFQKWSGKWHSPSFVSSVDSTFLVVKHATYGGPDYQLAWLPPPVPNTGA